MIIPEVDSELRPSQADVRRLNSFTATKAAHIVSWLRDFPDVLIENVIADCLTRLETLEIGSALLLAMEYRTKHVIFVGHFLNMLQPFVFPSEGYTKNVTALERTSEVLFVGMLLEKMTFKVVNVAEWLLEPAARLDTDEGGDMNIFEMPFQR